MTEYILKSWSLVKLGTMSAQKKLFFSLRKAKRNLNIIDTNDISPENAKRLSEQFNMSEADILHLDRRMNVRDMSLNAPLSTGEDESIEFMDALEDEGPSPETIVADGEESKFRNGHLKAALRELSERDREIFIERRLTEDPISLERLGVHYGISRERVRQLENRAFEKVQKLMKSAIDPAEAL